jgi:hypothetical protein
MIDFDVTKVQCRIPGSVGKSAVTHHKDDPFVEALRARLKAVAPEFRRTWNGTDLAGWWERVRLEPGFSKWSTNDFPYIRGICSDLFGPNVDEE